MAKKKPEQPEKPGRTPKRSPHEVLFLRLPTELHRRLMAYLASLSPKPTGTAIGLTALDEFLTRRGFPPQADGEGS